MIMMTTDFLVWDSGMMHGRERCIGSRASICSF
jgi:hypothetical protein